jgi:hypothetical protein
MKNLRWKLLLLVMVGMWLGTGRVMFAAPFPDDCAQVCGSTTSCNEQCFPDELAWINGNWISCLTWGDYEEPCCGDFECSGGETASSCFGDCHCGDDVCNAGETIYTCPADCDGEGGPGGGGPDCGNNTCNGTESCSNCPEDCWEECTCGDSVCNPPAEGGGPNDDQCPFSRYMAGTCEYCPQDCGACEFSDCDPQVCDNDGRCTACSIDIECEGARWCNNGACTLGTECGPTNPCTLPNTTCNSNGVCRPNV